MIIAIGSAPVGIQPPATVPAGGASEAYMAKPKHTKRSRPRPLPARKHRAIGVRAAERQSRLELERWRRSQSAG